MRQVLRIRLVFWRLLIVAGALICAATILGFAGPLWWVLDLFSHFRVQYLLSILPIVLLLLLGKRFRTSAAFALCAAINFSCILPYYFASPNNTNGPTLLRAISINVNTANQRYDLVRQYIIDNNPDVVLLIEVDAIWINELEQLASLYPHRKSEPRDDNFGIALYSKLAFSRCEVLYLGQAEVPSVVGEFDIANHKLTILGTHPLPPIDSVNSFLRNDQLEALGTYIASVPGPKMLMGDLNVSPWSYYFGKLLDRAGLADSSKGRGIQPTWPTHRLWLRIPIDFCLVSEGVIIKDKRVGANVGSDHFPLLVDVALSE